MAAAAEVHAALSSSASFEELIARLQLPDNKLRRHAEDVYEQAKKFPDACVGRLVAVMRGSKDTENRAFCAILLRKVCSVVGATSPEHSRCGAA